MAIVAAEPLFDYSKKIFMSRSERFYHGVAIAGRLMELKREHGLTLEEHGILRAMVGDGITCVFIIGALFQKRLRYLLQDNHPRLCVYACAADPVERRAAGQVVAAREQLCHLWKLCPDRAGPREQRARAADRGRVGQGDRRVCPAHALGGGNQVVDWYGIVCREKKEQCCLVVARLTGGLGKMATHSIVWARLLIDGKDNGVQPFMVQIRYRSFVYLFVYVYTSDLKTHKALPGVTVGDIGPKFGFAGVDNGFLKLDHVRIPRTDMLCRNTQVSKDGKVQTANRALSYGGMLAVRAGMVKKRNRNRNRNK